VLRSSLAPYATLLGMLVAIQPRKGNTHGDAHDPFADGLFSLAEQACQQGFALAEREHAHVLLVHVLLRSDLAFGDIPLPLRGQADEELQTEAEARLRTLAPGQLVTVETLVVWGSPPVEICRIAQERHVDLIVMGTHGRTGLTHLFIGSVAGNSDINRVGKDLRHRLTLTDASCASSMAWRQCKWDAQRLWRLPAR
jgi:universal stress protein A